MLERNTSGVFIYFRTEARRMLDEDDLARVALVGFGYNCGILFRDLLFFWLCNFFFF